MAVFSSDKIYSPSNTIDSPSSNPEDGFLSGGRKEYSGNYMLSSACLPSHRPDRTMWVAPGYSPRTPQIFYSASTASKLHRGAQQVLRNEMDFSRMVHFGEVAVLPGTQCCSSSIPALLSRHKTLLIYCHKGIFNSMCVMLSRICKLLEGRARFVWLTIDSAKPRPMPGRKWKLQQLSNAQGKYTHRYSYIGNTHTTVKD